MNITNVQVIIVGGGLVGLTLASALAKANLQVAVIETQQPSLTWDEDSLEARVSALNLAAWHIFQHLDIWQTLNQSSYGLLRRLIVWDHIGGGEITFDCTQVGAEQCGFIIENRILVRALWQQLNLHPNVQLLYPHQPKELWRSKDHVQLILDNQHSIRAQLLIGADGGHSWVREQMGSSLQQHNYQQQALICIVKSEHPHQDTAWQNFLPTGPIASLPLADKHHSAIVWSTQSIDAKRLLSLENKPFGYELTNALEQRLGQLEVMSPISSYPLIMRHTNDYVSERLALVGDAAHTIHPLAGQGANLGLLDAACLAKFVAEAVQKNQDLGSMQTLRRYERWRKADNSTMQIAMTCFNQLFSNSTPWLIPLRSQGLKLADRMGFFKNWVMRYAMGTQRLDQLNLNQ